MRDHKIHARSRDLSKTMNSVGYWEPDIADINSIFSGAETSTRACHISTFNKGRFEFIQRGGLDVGIGTWTGFYSENTTPSFLLCPIFIYYIFNKQFNGLAQYFS